MSDKSPLEEDKLRLEIKELSRSPWSKPGVVVPILATVMTLALSQYLGVFDVQRQKIEIANREAVLAKSDLEKSIAALRDGNARLREQELALEERKRQLAIQLKTLSEEANQAKESARRAETAAALAKSEYKQVYNSMRALVEEKVRRQIEECGDGKKFLASLKRHFNEPNASTTAVNEELDRCFARLDLQENWPPIIGDSARNAYISALNPHRAKLAKAAIVYIRTVEEVWKRMGEDGMSKEDNALTNEAMRQYYEAHQEFRANLRLLTR